MRVRPESNAHWKLMHGHLQVATPVLNAEDIALPIRNLSD